jgi:hypothetical protein
VARLKEKLKHIICTAKNNLKDVKGTESKCPYVQIKLLEYLCKLTIKYYPEFNYQTNWFKKTISIHDKIEKMCLGKQRRHPVKKKTNFLDNTKWG